MAMVASVEFNDNVTTGEDVAVTIEVLANDTDIDGDALTYRYYWSTTGNGLEPPVGESFVDVAEPGSPDSVSVDADLEVARRAGGHARVAKRFPLGAAEDLEDQHACPLHRRRAPVKPGGSCRGRDGAGLV